uniref:Uncharacterized protein n=1 Tax=Eutreptiella gymnastica TaxID=73025 RepID=A0A6T2I9J1_9EUGL
MWYVKIETPHLHFISCAQEIEIQKFTFIEMWRGGQLPPTRCNVGGGSPPRAAPSVKQSAIDDCHISIFLCFHSGPTSRLCWHHSAQLHNSTQQFCGTGLLVNSLHTMGNRTVQQMAQKRGA